MGDNIQTQTQNFLVKMPWLLLVQIKSLCLLFQLKCEVPMINLPTSYSLPSTEVSYSLTTAVVLNQEQFCTLGNIWKYLETFLVVTTGNVADIWWVEAKYTTKHPAKFKTASTAQKCLIQHSHSPKIEAVKPRQEFGTMDSRNQAFHRATLQIQTFDSV